MKLNRICSKIAGRYFSPGDKVYQIIGNKKFGPFVFEGMSGLFAYYRNENGREVFASYCNKIIKECYLK